MRLRSVLCAMNQQGSCGLMSIRRSAADDSDAFAHVLSCVEDFAWYMPGLRRGLPTHNCGAAGEGTTGAFKTATQLCHRVDCGSRLRRR